MKSLLTRWKVEPLYPKPASPVHSCLKFSAVLGTSSPYRPITILPAGAPPMSMSMKTFFVIASGLWHAVADTARLRPAPLLLPALEARLACLTALTPARSIAAGILSLGSSPNRRRSGPPAPDLRRARGGL